MEDLCDGNPSIILLPGIWTMLLIGSIGLRCTTFKERYVFVEHTTHKQCQLLIEIVYMHTGP